MAAHNDFIFSVIAEETGFVGVFGLLTAYVLLFYSTLRTAFFAPPYGRLLAVGVTMMLFFHVFINIGMSMGVAPVSGLSLPLVSYGGSFIVITMAALRLLQSIRTH
jgi:rod shape determining protein RodA